MIPQEGKVLVKFSASWCGPCQMLAMTMKDVDFGVPVVSVDIDENLQLATQYGIRSVPTLILIEDGKELKRANGALPENKIKEFVAS